MKALLDAGADVNQLSAGDKTSPLLMAIINGHFDLAKSCSSTAPTPNLRQRQRRGAALRRRSTCSGRRRRSIRSPKAYSSRQTTYLELMKVLLDKGADRTRALNEKVWYSGYNFDLAGVDESGATPFWRAAYATDVEAMKLLVANGADPNIPTMKPAGRPRTATAAATGRRTCPACRRCRWAAPASRRCRPPSGVGYGEGFAANSHRYAPGGIAARGQVPGRRARRRRQRRDHEGNTALHQAASRGDIEMILYLVSKGADVKARQPRRPDDRRHGQRAGAAHAAVSRRRWRCS